ncbi:MAG: hypothetical protein KAQ88_06950, partial [Hyphomicrobiaceae bacterium]|nr:hypothetical protein [Hyphomicrobiaceae bacterium]
TQFVSSTSAMLRGHPHQNLLLHASQYKRQHLQCAKTVHLSLFDTVKSAHGTFGQMVRNSAENLVVYQFSRSILVKSLQMPCHETT